MTLPGHNELKRFCWSIIGFICLSIQSVCHMSIALLALLEENITIVSKRKLVCKFDIVERGILYWCLIFIIVFIYGPNVTFVIPLIWFYSEITFVYSKYLVLSFSIDVVCTLSYQRFAKLVLQNFAIPGCFPCILFCHYLFFLPCSGCLVIARCGSISVRELVKY